jgi:phage tail-like protein
MSEPGNDPEELLSDEPAGHGMSRRMLLGGAAAAGGAGLAAAVLQASRADHAAAGALGQVEPPVGSLFQLEVEGVTGFFTEVSGLGSENEILEQKVSPGENTVLKAPGRLKWNDIVLKRGVTANLDLYDWRRLQEDSTKAIGKDGSIMMLDNELREVARWNFEAAWPSKLSAGSHKLLSDDVMVIEEFVLVPERIRRAT